MVNNMNKINDTYKITIIHNCDENPLDNNVDVVIECPDKTFYTTTFFTIENIKFLMEKDKIHNEHGDGLYFWAVDMIIVKELNISVIVDTIRDIISQNDFNIFGGPNLPDEYNDEGNENVYENHSFYKVINIKIEQ